MVHVLCFKLWVFSPDLTWEALEVGLPVLGSVRVVPEVRGLTREGSDTHEFTPLSRHSLTCRTNTPRYIQERLSFVIPSLTFVEHGFHTEGKSL